MAYKLKTTLGKAIYGARKFTVEPVIGIIKEVLGFRQFSDALANRQQRVSGHWSVWLSISSASIPYSGWSIDHFFTRQLEKLSVNLPNKRIDMAMPSKARALSLHWLPRTSISLDGIT
jgi:hypothetical protein